MVCPVKEAKFIAEDWAHLSQTIREVPYQTKFIRLKLKSTPPNKLDGTWSASTLLRVLEIEEKQNAY